jgi:hypothetical protein
VSKRTTPRVTSADLVLPGSTDCGVSCRRRALGTPVALVRRHLPLVELDRRDEERAGPAWLTLEDLLERSPGVLATQQNVHRQSIAELG